MRIENKLQQNDSENRKKKRDYTSEINLIKPQNRQLKNFYNFMFDFSSCINFFSTDGDVAFCFTPQIDENEIVCKTRTGGNWGPEQKVGANGIFEVGKKTMVSVVHLPVVARRQFYLSNVPTYGNQIKIFEKKKKCNFNHLSLKANTLFCFI